MSFFFIRSAIVIGDISCTTRLRIEYILLVYYPKTLYFSFALRFKSFLVFDILDMCFITISTGQIKI